MPSPEELLDEMAGAVLDGTAIDWAAAESSVEEAARPFVRHLQLVASVAHVQRLVQPDQWGHLRLIEQIGRGSFGEVYRAWDTRLDREVALKLMPARSSDSQTASTVIHEGRLLARVRHPNVVTIYGAERIGDRVGLWMEFIRGHTLAQLLKDATTVTPAEVVHIGLELCHAVSAVHAAGLLHRDIKAHNVMRAEDGRIVLMDFGAGAELDDTTASELAGTPLYLAPEVLAGGPATVQSDIYSLGVLLYHLVAGSYPVKGRSIRDVRQAHERGERIELRRSQPQVRPALAAVIERACDPRSDRRYESIAALTHDLTSLRQPRESSRMRIVAAAIAALVVVLLTAEAVSRISGHRPGLASRLVGVIVGAPKPVEHPIIVVRPFENRGDPDNTLFADMITNGLIRQLGIIEGLEVRSQDTSFSLRTRPRDLAATAKQLGVNLVLEGDARVSGDMLVIRAALVSVTDGKAVWEDAFEGAIGSESEIAETLEELTRAIVNRLRLKLGRRTQRRYETDLATLMDYQRARALRDGRGTRAGDAIKEYEKVIAADPNYAPALAELAVTYADLGIIYPAVDAPSMPPADVRALMAPLIQRALLIDPQLAEAHAANGFDHALALEWADAEASFRRAIELEPTRSRLYGDYVLSVMVPWGRLGEGLRVLEAALENDPLSLDLRRILARVQLNAGRYDEALQNCQRVLDEDPSFPFCPNFIAWARLFGGDRAGAFKSFEGFYANGRRPGVLGYMHAINGRRAEAEAIANAPRFAQLPLRRAEIYGLLGDADKTLEALEDLADLNPFRAAFLLTQPEFAVLRGDPRVAEFRRNRLGFRD